MAGPLTFKAKQEKAPVLQSVYRLPERANPQQEEIMSENIQKRILVVDDEINVCKSIRQAILSPDYEVDMALSGEEALTMDSENNYDMVVTDLMMPGISGIDLLTALKARRPEVILIMVTGYPTIKTAVQSIHIGAFDYIPKPFTPKELRGLVSRAFKKTWQSDSSQSPPPSPPKPADLYTLGEHTWLRREDDRHVTIGIAFDYLKNIDQIVDIEVMPENKAVFQGEACARLTDAKGNVHRIWSPASGHIGKTNGKVIHDLKLLTRDPYGEGWLLQIEVTDMEKDLESLKRMDGPK
jgi:CheY-like chemotaxis protein